MKDTETRAERTVTDGTLYVRRRPGARWEINFWERDLNLSTALAEGVLKSAVLSGRHFLGQTFDTPEQAAEAVRQMVAV